MNLTELLLDENIDQVLAFDSKLHVLAWNKACEVVTGISRETISGKNIYDFFPELKEDERIKVAIAAALCGQKSFVPAGGTLSRTMYAEQHFIPLKDDSGAVIGVLNVIHDVAHRIKAEQELTILNTDLLRYQKEVENLNSELLMSNRRLKSLNSELKTFTHIAVRDYSETLRQLYLHFEYIVTKDAAKLSNSGKANIRKAQAAIQKMKLLTDDIIAFTRLNEFGADRQPINLNDVVKTVVSDMKTAIDNAGATVTMGQLPTIQGYHFLVSLLFYHLVENAIKFRKEGIAAVVDISFEHVVNGKGMELATGTGAREYYVITVRDNGIGFDEQHAESIFHIFSKLIPEKYKGAGIGLAICRKAMELHGGYIMAASKQGSGASFHCYFPVV